MESEQTTLQKNMRLSVGHAGKGYEDGNAMEHSMDGLETKEKLVRSTSWQSCYAMLVYNGASQSAY